MKVDFLIVGSGLFGATFAHQAKLNKKTVLVIDRRSHAAGNVYTEKVKGIDVHRYGPHIFNTNKKELWDYANQFATFNHYNHKVKVNYKDKIYSFPINLETFYQVYGIRTPQEAKEKIEQCKIKPIDWKLPDSLEEWCLNTVGPELYNIFIKGYTTKQWGRDPSELPVGIIKRIPVRYTWDDRYHESKYSGIPDEGYTRWVQNMLDGIDVELETDFFKFDWKNYAHTLIYTGKIDEYFNYSFGDLEYRTLSFKDEMQKGDFQGVSQMNFTEASIPWTRITEHKHFNNKNQEDTVITYEYSAEYTRETTPYYPINDKYNNAVYQKYREAFKNQTNVYGGGRLLDYQYLDMDATIARALHLSKKLLNTA